MAKQKLIKISKKEIDYFRANPPKVIKMIDEFGNEWEDIWIESRKVYKMMEKTNDSDEFIFSGEHTLEEYIPWYMEEEGNKEIEDNWIRQGIKEAIFKQQMNEIISGE